MWPAEGGEADESADEGDPHANQACINETVKRNLLSVLQRQHRGINLDSLDTCYRDKIGTKLDFRKYGFDSLLDMLKTVTEIRVIQDRKSGNWRVYLNDGEGSRFMPEKRTGGSERNRSSGGRGGTQLSSAMKNKSPARTCQSRQQSHCSERDREELERNERERERQLRKKPMPTRFRNDDYWDLYIHNFPDDTTEEQLMDVFGPYGCIKMRMKNPPEKSPFAFPRFLDYEKAAEAFYTLDGTEFNGLQLRVSFARSSICPEDVYKKQRDNDRFNVTVNTRQDDAGSWDADDDDDVDDDDNDDDLWDACDNGADVRNEASGHSDATANRRCHDCKDACDESDVVCGDQSRFADCESPTSDVGSHVGRTAAADTSRLGDVAGDRGVKITSNSSQSSSYPRGGGSSGRGKSDSGQRRPGSSDNGTGRREDIGHSRASVGGTRPGGKDAVTSGACSNSTNYCCTSRHEMDLSNNNGSDSHDHDDDDDVNDSNKGTVTGRDSRPTCVSGDNRCCDSKCGDGSRKSAGNEGASGSTGAATRHQSDDITDTDETRSQLAFVRLQRMKWLESQTRSTTKQSDSRQSHLVTAEKSSGRSEEKPDLTVSTVRRPSETVTTAGVNTPVVTRQRDTTVLRYTTEGQRPETKIEPATSGCVGKETDESDREGGKNCRDDSAVRNCQSSRTGSGDVKVKNFGSRNDDNESESETTVKEKPCLDGQRSRCETESDTGISADSLRTESDLQLQQQRLLDARATASSKLSSDDNQFSDTQPKEAAVAVKQVETISTSIFSDPPKSASRVLLSTPNDLNITSTHRSVTVSGMRHNLVLETTDTASHRLHDATRHLKDFDSSDLGSAPPSDKVPSSSHMRSLYVDEPLIEDEFDVYMKKDGLDFWSPGHSASESLSAHIQHDVPSIEPPEGFADTDDTLLKLPVISASEVVCDKSEEGRLAEETFCQSACKLVHNVPSNTPDVEKSASDVKTLPSSSHMWTCVYSRNDGEVGKVSMRFSGAYRDVKSSNSILGDVEATTALVEGICSTDTYNTNEAIHSQTSSSQSAYSPVCRPVNDQDPVTNDTQQLVGGKTSQCSATLQGSTPRAVSGSAKNFTEAEFNGSVCEKSSDKVPSSSTVRELGGRGVNTMDEPRDSIDGLKSLPPDEANSHTGADSGDRMTDAEYDIPAEMDADFIDQMHLEMCPNVLRNPMEDFSSEISLAIVVTHVVDARHFWGQIVSEGIQKQRVERILETMDQLKKSENLQRVTSRYRRRAATFYAGELSRVWISTMSPTNSQVHHIDFGNQQTVLTRDLFELPAYVWDIPPAAVPCRWVRPDEDVLQLQRLLNRIVSVRLVPSVRSDKERHILDVFDVQILRE